MGGSVASSALGIARSTLDIDLVADLRASHVAALVARLQADYYIDGDMIYEAIQRRGSFNVIHLATMVKVDVFVLGPRPFDRASFSRVIHEPLGDSRERSFPLTTPEDIVIRKLEWYRLGGGVSQRQWADIIGVLKLQGDALDLVHMAHWARGARRHGFARAGNGGGRRRFDRPYVIMKNQAYISLGQTR